MFIRGYFEIFTQIMTAVTTKQACRCVKIEIISIYII